MPGDRVAILGLTSADWTLADCGALLRRRRGGADLPHQLARVECATCSPHSRRARSFCENAAQVAKIEQVARSLPELEHDRPFEDAGCDSLTLDGLRRRARGRRRSAVGERLAVARPTTLRRSSTPPARPDRRRAACSATRTSSRRRAMYVAAARASTTALAVPVPAAGARAREGRADRRARASAHGSSTGAGDPTRSSRSCSETAPTHFPAVPRIYEKMHSARDRRASARRPRAQRVLFEWALEVGRRARRALSGAGKPSLLTDRSIRASRTALGAREGARAVRRAPAARAGRRRADRTRAARVLRRLRRAGARGLRPDRELRRGDAQHRRTRSASAPSASRCRAPRWRSRADGEILIRGPHVFEGYYNDPAATEERSWTAGCAGRSRRAHPRRLPVDHRPQEGPDHHLQRQEHHARSNIESAAARDALDHRGGRLRRQPALPRRDAHARPRRVAEARRAARHRHRPATIAARRARPRGARRSEVDAVNGSFARIEQVKRFAILDHDLTQADGELTPTLKVKRAIVYERYADLFAGLYAAEDDARHERDACPAPTRLGCTWIARRT